MKREQSLTAIINKTAKGFGISTSLMMSSCRHEEIVVPRMTAMALAHEYGFTGKRIERRFNKTRGTAINAYKKITNLAETDEEFLNTIKTIWEEIHES
jgi:chromosomal replication initiation ATPase DnaA